MINRHSVPRPRTAEPASHRPVSFSSLFFFFDSRFDVESSGSGWTTPASNKVGGRNKRRRAEWTVGGSADLTALFFVYFVSSVGLAGCRHRAGRQDDRLGAHWNLHQRQQLVRSAAARPRRCRCALGRSVLTLRLSLFFFFFFRRNVVMGGVKAYGSYPVWSVSSQSRGSQWAVGRVRRLGPQAVFFAWLTVFFIFECCTMRDFIF